MSKVITARGIGAPDFVNALRAVVYSLASTSGSHFTDALPKSSLERENLTGLRDSRVRITKISIQSVQQLLWEVLLYGTDNFEEAVMSDDKFIASVEMNMPLYAIQQTESQWRLEIRGLDIDYIDEDNTKELHVILRNLSPTAKIAGVLGEIKVEFTCEARS